MATIKERIRAEIKKRNRDMTREEQISAITDILFYNTATGELTVEKCYELAEKIVNQATGSMVIPDGLEEEAEKYEKEHTYQRYDGGGLTPEYDATLAEAYIAGAKWGEKNAYKAIMKEADKVRDKMYNVDYNIKIQYPKVEPIEALKK